MKFPSLKTQWGDYYKDTNYSDTAMVEKERIVSFVAED
jgi:hypothetical protein